VLDRAKISRRPCWGSRARAAAIGLVTVGLVLGLGTLLTQDAGGALGPKPRTASITFSRDGVSIYSVAARGGLASLILHGVRLRREFTDPAWSRDGRHLAVTVTTYPSHGFSAIAAVDGTRVIPLPSGGSGFAGGPSWNPDGSRIVAAEYDVCPASGCGGQLFFTSPTANSSTPIGPVALDPHRQDMSPSWSPDGGEIAFARFITNDNGFLRIKPRLYVIRPDNTGLRRLTTGYGNHPSWSPDGRKIAYDDGHRIRIVTADGSASVAVTRPATWDTDPAWSPDGRQIAFIRASHSGRGDLWIVRSNGSGARLLAKNADAPAWRPTK
jgi:Tol biopolymer transport system component